MSTWAQHDLTNKISEVLAEIRYDHHFGHPFATAYQVAIELQRRYPEVVAAIGEPLGGAETGQRSSLAQYIARELSRRIKADPAYPIVGLMRLGVQLGRIDTVLPEHEPEAMDRPPRQDPHGGEVYVYRRAGEPCLVCSTPIRKQTLDSRNLFWCLRCQRRSRRRSRAAG